MKAMSLTNLGAPLARRRGFATAILGASLILLGPPAAKGQTFSSGSDGSDGALNLAPNLGTIIFDPFDVTRWTKVLDQDGDGVYNFTTITIGAGTTLKMTASRMSRPIYWLASGDVLISGVIDLNGEPSVATADPGLRRLVPVGGSGGFAAGAGGVTGTSILATDGDGPGGGAAGAANCTTTCTGSGGSFSGNRYLLPLIGGSGGGGANWTGGTYYSGGAGGGAILIASSTQLTVSATGSITARGGSDLSAAGGAGSGGAIRLVAPALAGTGSLDVKGGSTGVPNRPTAGLVRLESYSGGTSLNLVAGGAFSTRGNPVDSSSLRPTSAVRVTAVGGVTVPVNAAGSFSVPDVLISSSTAVAVDIEATGIPPGTVVTLRVFPETPNDPTVVYFPTVQTTLAGTTQLSTATVNFTFPYGFSRGFLRATWVQ